MWEHINTSADFTTILEPNYAAGEFRMNTTLGPGLNWHTLAMDPLVPETDFIDLYSVTLHEVMHMLGFYSRITPDGSPLNGFYAPWDRQLSGILPDLPNPVTTDTELLVPDLTDPECCDAHEYNSAIIGVAPSILDLGCDPSAESVISYSYGPATTDIVTVRGEYNVGEIPDPTDEIINILSHLDSDCDALDYVMHARFTIGETRRVLTAPELDILCNLGYSLVTAPSTTCEEACNAVAIDDFFDSGFQPGPSLAITINYEDIITNDFLPPGTFTIDVISCDPFVDLDIDNRPDFSRVTINGLLSGYTQTICYTLTTACGSCDEGIITIVAPPGPNFPDGPICGSKDNILPWGDFEVFDLEGQLDATESFFAFSFLPNCDPLGIGTVISPGIPTNSPGVVVINSNQRGYLRGKTSGTMENRTNNESIYLPLSQPIFPGCTATFSLDVWAHPNDFASGEVGNVQLYGSRLPPCIMPDFADCTNITPDGFQCIESGIMVDNTMNSPVTYDNITWTNTTPNAIYYILVANHAAVLVGPTGQANGSVLVDNITVTQECSNELTVVANVTEMCAQDQIIIDYLVCLEGDSGNPATDIVLTVDLPNIPGLAFGNGDFQSETFTIPQVVPNENGGTCIPVSLVLDLTNSSVVEGSNLQFTLEGLADNSCIEGPVVTNVEAVDCITAQACPCEGPNAIEVIAGGGTYWQNTALGPLAANDLLSPNTIDLSNRCVTIRGKLLIGSDVLTQSYQSDLLFVSGALRMLPDAEIVIEDDASLMLFSVNEPDGQGAGLHGCEFMWQGITVETGGELRMYDSHIEDAEIAVQAFPDATLDIFNNVFVDNYIGLDIIGSVNGDPPGIVNVGINGIEKNLFDGITGLLGTSNNSIQMGDEAHAGVHLNNVSFLTIGSFGGEGNFFQGLQHGIESTHSNFHAIKADMQDISISGINTIGEDFVFLSNSKIERMPIGIDVNAGSISANNNQMSQISDTGIRVFGAGNMDLTVVEIINQAIDADRFCIDLTSTLDDNYLGVLGNQLRLSPLPVGTATYQERAAFRMLNAGADNAGFNLQAQVSSNDIVVRGAGVGIDIMNIGNIEIHYNDVTFYNPVEINDGVYRGISLADSDNNYLYGNSTQLGLLTPDFNELVSYHFAACQATRLCCNSSDDGLIGFEFAENCMDTEWRTSEINDHQIGLRINEGSLIGAQKYAGNRWNAPSYVVASAEHLSSFSNIIFQSRITIRSPFSPLWPATPPSTPNATGAPWFIPDDETNDALCNSDPLCLPIPPPFSGIIKETDRFLAGTTYQGAPYENFHHWEGRKFLLAKLNANPTYGQGDYQLQQFRNSQNNSLLANYLNLNEQMNAVHQGQPAPVMVHLDAIKTHFANLQNSETQYLNATSDTQRANLQEDYRDISADISTELQQINTLQNTAKTNGEAAAAQLIMANSTLSTPDIFTANQQAVNTIQLNLWSGLLPVLGSSEINSLEQIAYQCPLQGGNAVHRARAMLRGIGEYNFKGVNCVSAQALQRENVADRPVNGYKVSETEDKRIALTSWQIYPNPTSKYFRISGERLDSLQNVELYDLSGKLHQTWTLVSTDSSYPLSDNLVAGIYLLRLHLADGSQVNRKLVINK